MTPHERSPYSAIVDRPPLKPPSGGKVIIWTIVNLEVWDLSRASAGSKAGGTPAAFA
jgi:allantoinase